MNNNFDVFVSYCRNDNKNQWIEKFVEQIEKSYQLTTRERLRVYFDNKTIANQQDWEFSILNGLRESKFFLAFISPAYLKSANCRFEWRQYSSLCHSNFRGDDRLFKIYYSKVLGLHPNDIIEVAEFSDDGEANIFFEEVKKDFQYKQLYLEDKGRGEFISADFDLTNTNKEDVDILSQLNLHNVIDGGSGNFEIEDQRKNAISSKIQGISKLIAQRLDRIMLAAFNPGNIPNPNSHFRGRAELLQNIHKILMHERFGTISSIHGIGGLGKTSLALQYAHIYSEHYVAGGCWLIDCAGKTTLFDVFKSNFLSKRTIRGFDKTMFELKMDWFDDTGSLNYRMKVFFESICDFARYNAKAINENFKKEANVNLKGEDLDVKSRVLFILDNVTDAALLSATEFSILIPNDCITILITSRFGGETLPKNNRFVDFNLETLSDEEALSIFRSYKNIGPSNLPNYDERIRMVVKELDGYTLAVVLLAAYLGQHQDIDPLHCLEILKIDALSFLSEIEGKQSIVNDIHYPDLEANKPENRKDKLLKAAIQFPYRLLESDVNNKYALRILHYAVFMNNEYIDRETIDELLVLNFPELNHTQPHKPNPISEAWKVLQGVMIVENSRFDTSKLAYQPEEFQYKKIHSLVSNEVRKSLMTEEEKHLVVNNFYAYFDNGRFNRKKPDTPSRLYAYDSLIKHFLENDLITYKEFREWIVHVYTYRHYCLDELLKKTYESMLAHLHRKVISNNELELKENRSDEIVLKNLYLKRELVRIGINTIEFDENNLEGKIDEYKKATEYINLLFSVFNEIFKDKTNASDPQNKLFWDVTSFGTTLRFDYYDLQKRFSDIYLELKDYLQSLEVLDRAIGELEGFYKNDNAKIWDSATYSVFLSMKTQRANILGLLGRTSKPETAYPLNEIEAKNYIDRLSKDGMHRKAFEEAYNYADKAISDGKYEMALELFEIAKLQLGFASRHEVGQQYLLYNNWKISFKKTGCVSKTGKYDAKDFIDALSILLDDIEFNFSEIQKYDFVKTGFSANFLGFTFDFFRPLSLDNILRQEVRNISERLERIVKPLMLGDNKCFQEYILFYIIYAQFFDDHLNDQQTALKVSIEVYNNARENYPPESIVNFHELTNILFVILQITKIFFGLKDFNRLDQALGIYTEYIKRLLEFRTKISGEQSMNQYNILIEGYNYYVAQIRGFNK
jgi:hypothetical protein